MSAIEAQQLVRAFDDNLAVDGVDLTVDAGEIYGFLGPNGAGKSTCVRMLTTLLLPTSGQARVAGYDVVAESAEVRLRIGVALQEAALDEQQTGRELLSLQGRLYGLDSDTIARRIAEITEFIDLGDAFDDRLKTYSGGMKRRVDLAAALVHNPEVLFLDEPTTGLDPISRAKVWGEVRQLNDDLGMTVFLTTQYLEEADELADRVGIINHGRLAAEGRPIDLKRQIGTDVIVANVDSIERATTAVQDLPGVDSVESRGDEISIGTASGAALISPVAVALAEGNVGVGDIALRTPTLDDVFVSVTGERLADVADDSGADTSADANRRSDA